MKMFRRTWAALALGVVLFGSTPARAVVVQGTQAFADLGTPTANTTNILTATSLSIGDLTSTTSQTGLFAANGTTFGASSSSAMASQNLGAVSSFTVNPTIFALTSPNTTLTFGNGVFGTFTSTSSEATSSSAQPNASITYTFLGNWVAGTVATASGSTFSASVTLTFTQNGVGTSISDSASFSVPGVPLPTGVPEPSTWVMSALCLGLGHVVCVVRRRRSRAAVTDALAETPRAD